MFVFRETVEDHVTYRVASILGKGFPNTEKTFLLRVFFSASVLRGEERFSWKINEGKQEIMLES